MSSVPIDLQPGFNGFISVEEESGKALASIIKTNQKFVRQNDSYYWFENNWDCGQSFTETSKSFSRID